VGGGLLYLGTENCFVHVKSLREIFFSLFAISQVLLLQLNHCLYLSTGYSDVFGI
jgi:hypothetical protein